MFLDALVHARVVVMENVLMLLLAHAQHALLTQIQLNAIKQLGVLIALPWVNVLLKVQLALLVKKLLMFQNVKVIKLLSIVQFVNQLINATQSLLVLVLHANHLLPSLLA
jgi:hypothetical protein